MANATPRHRQQRPGTLSYGASLSCIVLLAATLAACANTSAPSDPARPNILWIIADDMGSEVGALGDTLARTPNLDRLEHEGAYYPNAFATAEARGSAAAIARIVPIRTRGEDLSLLRDLERRGMIRLGSARMTHRLTPRSRADVVVPAWRLTPT